LWWRRPTMTEGTIRARPTTTQSKPKSGAPRKNDNRERISAQLRAPRAVQGGGLCRSRIPSTLCCGRVRRPVFQFSSRRYRSLGQRCGRALVEVAFQVIADFLALIGQLKEFVVFESHRRSNQHGRKRLTVGVIDGCRTVVDPTSSL